MKRLFLAIAALVATEPFVQASAAAEAFCWASPRQVDRSVLCAPMDSARSGELLKYASVRALLDAGWSVVDVIADPRFSRDGVRLVLERRRATLPAPAAYYRPLWMIFPPP